MSLTPNEILEKEFPARFRGYDPEEVDSFLEEVSQIITSLIKEKNAMKDQLVVYKVQLADLKKREEEFREALTSAHKLSEKMKSQAEKDAELVLERAKLDAERIVADAHQEALQLEERIMGLRRIQRETAYKIRSVIESSLRVIDEETLPPEEVDQVINLAASEMRAIQEVPGDLSEGTNTVFGNGEETIRVNMPFTPDILGESVNEGGHENDSQEERPSQGPNLD
ncbi:MAG: DivIVA domain-containing protein [Deltaproteobacteria bacterium]|nr:DivIVA domain-containing protein [Deltaproteobacteria bacterium]MBW2350434.1 DivIVA domain-containing protein [Deltaproteobacteria bacterium]